MGGQRADLAPGGEPRPGDDQRDAHAVLVEVLLAQQPVLPHRQPVVGRVDDDRAPRVPARRQRRQHPADLRVQVADQRVVVGDVAADHRGGPRPGRQPLVADPQVAVVEGVLRQEVLRQRDRPRIAARRPVRRRRPRVVRRGEGQVEEERIVPPIPLQEPDRRVGEDLRGEPLPLGARLVRVDPRRIELVDRHAPVVAHPAEKDPRPVVESGGEAPLVVVPLPRREGAVPRPPQGRRQRGQRRVQRHRPRRVVHPPAPRGVERVRPRQQRRAARHADRPHQPAHRVRPPAPDPAGREGVQRRRLHPRRPQPPQRVEAVGDHEEDIRPLAHLAPSHIRTRQAGSPHRIAL